jgi:ATP-dependent Clp protease ATP-binding subunit ClpA
MLATITQKLRAMHTISALCQAAEKQALLEGQMQPGAEHFLLACFDLPDGSARRIFERLNKDPAEVRQAIAGQYADALAGLGLSTNPAQGALADSLVRPEPTAGAYRAQPSGQALMQSLPAAQEALDKGPLVGGHVLWALSTLEHGVAARALRRMGLESAQLQQAIRSECGSTAMSRAAS